MFKTSCLPGYNIYLDTDNAIVQKILIDLFRSNSIPVEEDTVTYDPEYPVLYWNGDYLSQRIGIEDVDQDEIYNFEDFINFFFIAPPRIYLADCMITVNSADVVTIKDVSLTFNEIKMLYEAMESLKQ